MSAHGEFDYGNFLDRYRKNRCALGSSGGVSRCIIYDRHTAGRGDLIMLRPSLVAKIKDYPDYEHILWVWPEGIPIVEDIKGLITIPASGGSGEFLYNERNAEFFYDFAAPALRYEDIHAPWSYDTKSGQLIATGNIVDKSRQEIFADVIDVKFDIANYNVTFSDLELVFASGYTHGLGKYICVQLNSNNFGRNYNYSDYLIEYIAKKYDGYVIVIDPSHEYIGKYSNVRTLKENNIRYVWAVIAGAKMFIGPDSFGIHAAGSTNVPTYGMFCSTDPEQRMKYNKVAWPKKYKKCDRQYCWYVVCKRRPCINSRLPRFYWNDAVDKLSQYFDDEPLPTFGKRRSLAIIILEGLGGTLVVSDIAKKIYEKTDVIPDIIIRRYGDLFIDNPYIGHITSIGDSEHGHVFSSVLEQYDVVVDIKSGIGKWYNGERLNIHQRFDEYKEIYTRLPIGTRELEKYKLSWVQMVNKSLGLPFDDIDIKVYNQQRPDIVLPEQYVVVGSGVDIWHRGQRQTKSWELFYWRELTDALINSLNIEVVQVGTNYDEYINGAFDLRGKTDIPQLLHVLDNARMVITLEGGLMHLAYAVKTKAVIIRGPTQGTLYSYPGQVYIDSFVCDGCYWDKPDWHFNCVKDCDVVCMKTITPERVFEAVKKELVTV